MTTRDRLESMNSLLAAVRTNQAAIQSFVDANPTRTESTAPPPPGNLTTSAEAPAPAIDATDRPPDLKTTNPIDHGDHEPPRVNNHDFMRTEKSVAELLSKQRLEPYADI